MSLFQMVFLDMQYIFSSEIFSYPESLVYYLCMSYNISILVLFFFSSLTWTAFCDPLDCSPSSSSVHGILQARILEWVAISFSRGSSSTRDKPRSHALQTVGQSCLTLLQPHGLYSPWISPGQNTGMGSYSLLQGIFPTQGSNPVSCIAGRFFTI